MVPKEDIRFDGQTAIVTGAGGGLGRTYALELARRGAKVLVNDLGAAGDGSGKGSSTPADRVVTEINEQGGVAVASYDSVSTPEGGEHMVKTALDAFGRVDILVNNAGILRDKSFINMSLEEWHDVMDVHLNGAFYVTQPAFRVMKENGYGRIVLTTSVSGLYGNFGQTNYSAAKMGIIGLMNTLKLEGSKYNINVNTVAPRAATRLTEDIFPSDMSDKMAPEFVAPVVIYLCSKICRDSGVIINAGSGFFSRAALMTAPPTLLDNNDNPPFPEDIRDHWKKISDMTEASLFHDAVAAVQAFTPQIKTGEKTKMEKNEQPLDIEKIFKRLPEAFNAGAAAGKNVIFLFQISGSSGGEWFVVVKDGTCSVEKGLTEKPTTTIKMADEDFMQLITGKIGGMQAFTSGKLKIEGDMMKALLIEKLFTLKA